MHDDIDPMTDPTPTSSGFDADALVERATARLAERRAREEAEAAAEAERKRHPYLRRTERTDLRP